MEKLSRKGQGLGFASVIVMVALMYFIFQYQVDSFDFIVNAGDQQAHLVTSFVETEKAKVYAQTAVKEAAYEAVWQISNKSDSCSSIVEACNNEADFRKFFEQYFGQYITIYSAGTDMISAEHPDYKFEIRCGTSGTFLALDTLFIEAFGHSEACLLRNNFPFPKTPCEDQNATTCDIVEFTDKRPGACRWNSAAEECEETKPAPDCEATTQPSACGGDCAWETSFSEDINVQSAPLEDYQFRVDSDAHFVETVDCSGYSAFVVARKV